MFFSPPLQVPSVSLREDLESRGGFDLKPAAKKAERGAGDIIPLCVSDQPTPRAFEARCVGAGLDREGVRLFCARAEAIVAAAGSDTEVSLQTEGQFTLSGIHTKMSSFLFCTVSVLGRFCVSPVRCDRRHHPHPHKLIPPRPRPVCRLARCLTLREKTFPDFTISDRTSACTG